MKIELGRYPNKGKRKMNIKIDKWDSWNMDGTLSPIILPLLKQLQATKHGAPNVDDTDVPDELKSTSAPPTENDWETDDNHFKRWDWVLEQMIWSFEQLIKDNYDSLYHHGKSDYDWVETDKLYPNPITGKMEKTFQMIDKDPNSHWYDSEGNKLHEDRIQEGLELFGKYYRALWD